MLNNKGFLKFISLLSAICLWIYVMGEVDPKTKARIDNISIAFVNTDILAENDMAVAEEEELMMSAVISGKRSDVNDVKKTGLTAYIDVTDCEEGSQMGKINVNVPDGIKLESTSDTYMKFKVEELVSEEKPVKMEFTGTAGTKDQEERAPEIKPDTVTVTGAKSSVEKVSYVRGLVNAQDVPDNESVWKTVDLEPVTVKGVIVPGLLLSDDTARARVQRLTVKSLSLEITCEALDEALTIDTIDAPKSISVVGTAEALKDLDKIQGTVDMSEITDTSYSDELTIELELPDQVYLKNEGKTLTAVITVKSIQ